MPKQTVDWTKQPLGLVPDADLAERLGVSVHTVRRQRQRRGILHLDMDIEQRIADALAQSDAPLTVKQLAEMLEKQDTWIQRKMLGMLKQGTVWRHRSGRGYVWTIAGKKLKRHALKGMVKATLKATPDEAAQLHGTACDDPVVDWGTVSFMDYDTEDRSDAFRCKRKRQTITLRHCIELFSEVHAMNSRHTACWKCPQGAHNRLRHCFDIDPTTAQISDALQVATGGSDRAQAEARLMRAYDNDA